ncbi:hypothetical protein O3M35_002771 [Rhynocoris fuscipes]|uniref:Uncharacterized protein n=1 Tax=Rhynocoris fuscipes TaxID=488301 RepID=A0AAW1CMR9_9HEMI
MLTKHKCDDDDEDELEEEFDVKLPLDEHLSTLSNDTEYNFGSGDIELSNTDRTLESLKRLLLNVINKNIYTDSILNVDMNQVKRRKLNDKSIPIFKDESISNNYLAKTKSSEYTQTFEPNDEFNWLQSLTNTIQCYIIFLIIILTLITIGSYFNFNIPIVSLFKQQNQQKPTMLQTLRQILNSIVEISLAAIK